MSDELNNNEQDLYLEAWVNKNFWSPSEGESDDFDEEMAAARAKIAELKNQLVSKHGENFLNNIVSSTQLLLVPIETTISPYIDALRDYAIKRNSPSELIRETIAKSLLRIFAPKLAESSKVPVSEERAAQLYECLTSEDSEQIKAVSKQLLLELLKSKPQLVEWYEKLYELALCTAWTSYEVLTADLWEELVNSSIKAAHNVCNTETGQEVDSKKINLNELFKYKLDLSNHMGSLLKRRFDFTSTNGINLAFDACFGDREKGSKQERAEKEKARKLACKALSDVEQMRHLILHKGGLVDHSFIEKTQANYEIGDRLKLTSYDLGKGIDEVFKKGLELIDRAEEWLNEDAKPKEKDELP